MKVCIILNGQITEHKVIREALIRQEYDYIICADGGANHAYKMDIVPDYIIGDLDSVQFDIINYYKNCGVRFEEFPSKKNETDTELCIYLADKLNAKEIHFIGSLGGRIDHTIANVNLLYYVRKMDIVPKIISEKEQIYIAINEEKIIHGNKGDTISIIPINGDAKGVTLTNLEYPLNNYDMKFYLPLGISNVMLSKECKVRVDDGSLLIIRNI
ncbi:thiamine diphosphokinase [Romboutsia sp.]|uniref:thiamine diphosphokinase n=1 Tax=Romboutsia sp. TaxID=1965302 RepID=UPI002C5C5014|nr:thiamine diphosphokinase [Romboutsia sp.]HSQ89666.1 thiamine diphosphokinase [Romboutsia sp.]